MKKTFTAAVLAAVSLLFLAVTTPSQAAAGDVKIVRVGYNAVGPDSMANRWQENITIRNVGNIAVNIGGWYVHDAYRNAAGVHSHRYTFPVGTVLAPGATATVYASAGTDVTGGSSLRFFMNSKCCKTGHFLNNDADVVTLRSGDGVAVDQLSWDFHNGFYVR